MIVITIPTGQIGRQVIDRILGAGEMIRVIARAPSRLSPQVRWVSHRVCKGVT